MARCRAKSQGIPDYLEFQVMETTKAKVFCLLYENTVIHLKYSDPKSSQGFRRFETSSQLIDVGIHRTLPRD